MAIERRRFLQAAGVGAVLGLSGCTGNTSPPQANNETAEGSGGSESGDGSTQELTLATTTSTYDTGLLDALNPVFEEKFNARVKTISQGTGAAIETARNGDADVILVHARGAEDEFLQDGYGVNRRDVMFNDFVVVGPADDPAGISGMESAADAFATVADAGATFVSRGDDSGTNKKELLIWEAAGVEPSGTWYREIGKGMGDTLVQADQSGAYTLSDRGTFLATQDNIDLEIQVQGPLKGGPTILKNPYGVIPVNPAKYPDVNYSLAMAYAGFLTSPEGQEIISNYTANGSQLFFPNALSENPQFGQYVPVNYDGGENASSSASVSDAQFESWVAQHVPEDF
ncbi:substrate-binding domain-containing protein [Haloferax volcanii]|uniref:Putative ABC transporter anion-binding protein HVO_1888 n=3 Tax=Haloferax volcanii TaxID=2246 RepID=ANTRB_HALVD|nr:substrate-binding domain-containing protein [Haloferax volcanii]D4GSY9.1 RecName: Full=Putative ABC transporter anion-binding protein HVO_1888; Flags: Precursor [Haloferax volcanii DS2]ADE05022.1 ABC-type transport system periplasmic substrate-binding protein (probable substrate tungstate) [Haloferax volcanii DS2]ELY34781.1 putative sulfate/tungstate ABC transporter periplasmic substrate-binding protein [Haloferax volcanii DS2]MBS8120016.1 substrate-binding domain-containing protein [Halofer